MSHRRLLSLVTTVALAGLAWAQRASVESLARPAIPADPLEPVMGEAQAVQTPEQRQAATSLLENARALSNVRAHPYDLKTTFTSFGSSSSDGAWSLEDISPSRNVYRWTAQGPGYSAVNLYNSRLLYSNLPSGAIPLRLTQVREAIFFIYPNMGPYMSLRTATGSLNGASLQCVLAAQAFGGKSFSGGRNWEESEYCVDPQHGLLVSYSPTPGLYIHYDYTNAIRFHDKVIPSGFTIAEEGRPVIQAKTESVTDPTGLNPGLFAPAGLSSIGVGSVMTPPSRVRSVLGGVPVSGNASLDVVVLLGVSSPDGHLTEAEILASSNASLNQKALDRAKNWQAGNQIQTQSGTTPQSHEVIFTFEFVTPST